jgi:hypothetical protein
MGRAGTLRKPRHRFPVGQARRQPRLGCNDTTSLLTNIALSISVSHFTRIRFSVLEGVRLAHDPSPTRVLQDPDAVKRNTDSKRTLPPRLDRGCLCGEIAEVTPQWKVPVGNGDGETGCCHHDGMTMRFQFGREG